MDVPACGSEQTRLEPNEQYLHILKSKFIYRGNQRYSIRLDNHVRSMMDEMRDINWQAEIRNAVEKMVQEKMKHRFLAEACQLRMKMLPIESSAAEMIREDRDAG